MLFFYKREKMEEPDLKHSGLFYLTLSGLAVWLRHPHKRPVAYLIFILCLAVFWAFRKFRLPASSTPAGLADACGGNCSPGLVWY